MKTLIIYGSQYGSTKCYAERLAKMTGKSQIPPEFYDESKIFHIRGAIDYSQLGLKHKVMMSLLHSKVSKMPESELNAEAKAMLETYGQQVDFVDFNALKKIISQL